MGTELLKLNADEGTLATINGLVEAGQLAVREAKDQFRRAFAIAAAIRQIGKLITPPMMEDIMLLRGRRIGFRTDRDKEKDIPYDVETVKECFIEATLHGARPMGNEFNIISGSPYYTKEYFERHVYEFPGLVNLVYSHGAVELRGGNAHVEFVAAWELDGEPMELKKIPKKLKNGQPFDDRIVVRVNEKMGHDAIIGKGLRKLFREIYRMVSHLDYIPMDGDAGDTFDVEPTKKARPIGLFDESPIEQGKAETPAAWAAEDIAAYIGECEQEFQRRDRQGVLSLMKKIAAESRLPKGAQAKLQRLANEALKGKQA